MTLYANYLGHNFAAGFQPALGVSVAVDSSFLDIELDSCPCLWCHFVAGFDFAWQFGLCCVVH